ncbi:hypothetical protein QR680_011660 [Steinernema hermaphroditum]|uniref:ZP domain-containing protein n=1 Tax=Steinernema hermaphroditum TaxID=289476 RepID=A0AA39LZ39_9BILA|nr:hypothetical protein QR680_011660 [Steinernema hermaphroditum]
MPQNYGFRLALLLSLLSTVVVIVADHASLVEHQSVTCGKDMITVDLNFKSTFDGVVFAENHFEDCHWPGGNSRNLKLELMIKGNRSRCGGYTNKLNGEYSLLLIVTPLKHVVTEEMIALKVRCVYADFVNVTLTMAPNQMTIRDLYNLDSVSEVTSVPPAPIPFMTLRESHSADGRITQEAYVGQRLTLDISMVGSENEKSTFFVHSCFAHDGTNSPDARVTVVDSKGCAMALPRAIESPLFTTAPTERPKHVYVHLYGFQFTSSQTVHFLCQVRPCQSTEDCAQCDPQISNSSFENSKEVSLAVQIHPQYQKNQNSTQAALIQADSPDCVSTGLLIASSMITLFICIILTLSVRHFCLKHEEESCSSSAYASTMSREERFVEPAFEFSSTWHDFKLT